MPIPPISPDLIQWFKTCLEVQDQEAIDNFFEKWPEAWDSVWPAVFNVPIDRAAWRERFESLAKFENLLAPTPEDYNALRYVLLGESGYVLFLWNTGRTNWIGQSCLGYVFWEPLPKKKPLFSGNDYFIGCFTCIDSEESLRGLVSFLSLRPGDTDDEYFKNYTDYQRQWAINHADDIMPWTDQDEPEWRSPFIDIPV
jgi:hypothetical protein